MPKIPTTIQATLRSLLLLAAALLSTPAKPQTLTVAVYHEAWCPSVRASRMTRMARTAAVAKGLQPASDCHLSIHARYLGISGASASSASAAEERAKTEHVNGYTKDDGTEVKPYDRSKPEPKPAPLTEVSPYVRRWR